MTESPNKSRRVNSMAAQKVRLAQGHAPVAEDAISGGREEIDIREDKFTQIIETLESPVPTANLQRDGGALRAIDLIWDRCLQDVESPDNPVLQIGKTGFVVSKYRGRMSGQSGGTAFGHIGGNLDLSLAWMKMAGSILCAAACASALARMLARLPRARVMTGIDASNRERDMMAPSG